MKTLNVKNNNDVKDKVNDVEIFGEDIWILVGKASSKEQKWMKSTKVLNLPNGCLIQVTTQQDKNVAEALEFIPKVMYNKTIERFVSLKV